MGGRQCACVPELPLLTPCRSVQSRLGAHGQVTNTLVSQAWTHLHPRVPGSVSYFLETKMYKEVRGGNKRGRRSEPQGREAREPFSPHKGSARGDTSEPQAAEFPHKAVGIPGDPKVSLGGCPWPCSHISSQLRCAEGSQGQGFNFAKGSSENCASQLPAASHVSKTEP